MLNLHERRAFVVALINAIGDITKTEALEALDREWPEQPSITCPNCKRTSYNPNDITNRYCGYCHRFLGDVQFLGAAQ